VEYGTGTVSVTSAVVGSGASLAFPPIDEWITIDCAEVEVISILRFVQQEEAIVYQH